jgi:hypothetical protein
VRLNPADATPAFSMLNVDEMQPNICWNELINRVSAKQWTREE